MKKAQKNFRKIENELIIKIEKFIKNKDIIIVSDYNKDN